MFSPTPIPSSLQSGGGFIISGNGGMFRGTYSLLGSPSTNYFYQANFGKLKETVSKKKDVTNDDLVQ